MVPAFRLDTVITDLDAAQIVAWIDAEGAQREIRAGGYIRAAEGIAKQARPSVVNYLAKLRSLVASDASGEQPA
jgi:hypothetical protein